MTNTIEENDWSDVLSVTQWTRSLPANGTRCCKPSTEQWNAEFVRTDLGEREIRLISSTKKQQQQQRATTTLKLNDVIGIGCIGCDENLSLLDDKVQLDIISYAIPAKNATKRQRTIDHVECDQKSADQLKRLFDRECGISHLTPPHVPATSNKHYLVLVNPFSGQKRAMQYWQTIVEPILLDARITVDLRLTERPGHATSLIQSLDNLYQYAGLIVNSGDGLINEVLTGLLLRPDRRRAIRIPIAHIPGGTSNGLAAAILYQCNEPFPPRGNFCMAAALMLARPRYLPLRLCHVETEDGGSFCMFMSASWGLMADIDIESERFRWAGMIRLHMEAVIRVIRLPTTARYRARVCYLPVQSPDARLQQMTKLKHNADRKLFGPDHFTYTEVPGYEHSDDADTGTSTCSMDDAFRKTHLVPGGQIPPLSEPVPNDWAVIESQFVFVCVSSLSHLGSDLPYIPSSRLDDDFVYLTLCDWNTVKTRLHVGQMLATLDQSKHLKHPCLQIIPVRACRIEPLDNCGGHMAVDGEVCRRGSAFQVAASSYCATVIGRNERQ